MNEKLSTKRKDILIVYINPQDAFYKENYSRPSLLLNFVEMQKLYRNLSQIFFINNCLFWDVLYSRNKNQGLFSCNIESYPIVQQFEIICVV